MLICFPVIAQEKFADSIDHTKPAAARKWLVGGSSIAVYGGSFILLNQAWYKDYPRTSFHSFNDGGEWNKMDKAGHAWTAYSICRVMTDTWKWAGSSRNNSVLLGTGTSLLYLLSVEYLDGRSEEWGWSWHDAGADLAGASLFALQEFAWKEQRIQMKFSSHHQSYEPSLRPRINELYGNTLPERLLKDYNAQTYWLSVNPSSFFKNISFPSWLNIAIGYGADGMYGGYENLAYDKDGNLYFDRRDIPRKQQWYLAPDIDLTRIPTKNKFLRSAFSVLNILKFPSPALELTGGKLKVKAMAF